MIGIVCLRLSIGVQLCMEFILSSAWAHYILHSVEFLSKMHPPHLISSCFPHPQSMASVNHFAGT